MTQKYEAATVGSARTGFGVSTFVPRPEDVERGRSVSQAGESDAPPADEEPAFSSSVAGLTCPRVGRARRDSGHRSPFF